MNLSDHLGFINKNVSVNLNGGKIKDCTVQFNISIGDQELVLKDVTVKKEDIL